MIGEMARLRAILRHPLFVRAMEQVERCERDRIYCGHGLPHLLDVARIAALLAADRQSDCPRDVIYAAALLHDIGRPAQYTTGEPHARAGVPLAREILRDTDFSPAERENILDAVRGHQTGGAPEGLTRLICEADRASRMCFCCAAQETCHWPQERRNRSVRL